MHRRQLLIIFSLICSGSLQALRADERAESTRGFKNWDKNGDGFLVPLEVPEGPREIFNNVDRNKDGKVTLEEHLLATVGPEKQDKRKVYLKPSSLLIASFEEFFYEETRIRKDFFEKLQEE